MSVVSDYLRTQVTEGRRKPEALIPGASATPHRRRGGADGGAGAHRGDPYAGGGALVSTLMLQGVGCLLFLVAWIIAKRIGWGGLLLLLIGLAMSYELITGGV